MFQWCSMYPWAHSTILYCVCFANQVKRMGAVGSKCVHHCTTLYQRLSSGQYSTRKDEASVIHIYLLCRRLLLNCSSMIITRACQCASGVFRSNISYHHYKSECHQSMRTSGAGVSSVRSCAIWLIYVDFVRFKDFQTVLHAPAKSQNQTTAQCVPNPDQRRHVVGPCTNMNKWHLVLYGSPACWIFGRKLCFDVCFHTFLSQSEVHAPCRKDSMYDLSPGWKRWISTAIELFHIWRAEHLKQVKHVLYRFIMIYIVLYLDLKFHKIV